MDNNKIDVVLLKQVTDFQREIESWVFAEGEMDDTLATTLVGVHRNVHDFYGARPFLIFPIDKPLSGGQIFRDVFYLKPIQVPLASTSFLTNGIFLRECLPSQLVENDEEYNLHTLDAMQEFLNSPNSIDKMNELQQNAGCILIGVHQTNPVHLSRGI